MPATGETEIQDGPDGIKLHLTWGEDEGLHQIYIEYPPDMPEAVRNMYKDALTMCLLEEGVNPFADSIGDRE